MIQGIVCGDAHTAEASPTKGWVVGHMQEGLAATRSFEIKMWHYAEPFEYGRKVFEGIEFISIYGGAIRIELEQEINGVLKTDTILLDGARRDYVILPPGITKQVFVEKAPAFGDTVRWPSVPGFSRTV